MHSDLDLSSLVTCAPQPRPEPPQFPKGHHLLLLFLFEAQILCYASADPIIFCHQRAQSPFAWLSPCAVHPASAPAQVRRAGGTAGGMETQASHELWKIPLPGLHCTKCRTLSSQDKEYESNFLPWRELICSTNH